VILLKLSNSNKEIKMNKLEYIWVDGVTPTNTLRSKTKVLEDFGGELSECPVWGFDGSSTNQAKGSDSDCVLNPVRLYHNPIEKNGYLVLCDVENVDGTKHDTNQRSSLSNIARETLTDPWFGMEQEYTMFKDDAPLGWQNGEPPPQGDYYCGRNIGEEIAREHMDACMRANIKISGINSEVMLGQWEYQIGPADPLRVSDDLWVARWLMEKICAKHGVTPSLDPKPIKGDWNGAGCHTNFSTKEMRNKNGIDSIYDAVTKLSHKHREHIAAYGANNDERLTGDHETCDIDTFKCGVSDRGASIRIPWQTHVEKSGYLEDRRPSANCDPYTVCHRILKTVL
jgi:glutamine synthetase